MNNQQMAKAFSVIVIVVSVLVMVGWFFDIGVLKSILPGWVTMKFTTALCFFLSGLILFFIGERLKEKSSLFQVALPIASLIILLLMTTLLTSVIVGVRTGLEDLFVKEAAGAVHTTTPGQPSAGTMTSFILVGMIGLLSSYRFQSIKILISGVGIVVAGLGMLAVVGYVVDAPLLYYTVEGWSTAMAAHTAILFVITGLGLYLLNAAKTR